MDKPKRPPKSLLPTISLGNWKPDEQALNAAIGKKPDKKSDRGTNH